MSSLEGSFCLLPGTSKALYFCYDESLGQDMGYGVEQLVLQLVKLRNCESSVIERNLSVTLQRD